MSIKIKDYRITKTKGLQNVETIKVKGENDYEKNCKRRDSDVTVPYSTLSSNGKRCNVPNLEGSIKQIAC